jgi:diguanylate cyclase
MGVLTPFPQSKTIEEANGRILREVGRFLKAHALPPTPDNYRLAYALVVDPDSSLARAIAAATLDGVRLLQSEADRLLHDAGVDPAPADPAGTDAGLVRQQMEEFARTIETVRLETERYGRDLETGAAQIEQVGDAISAAGILAITGQMLARTRLAEQRLAAAEREASALREKLAVAEEDARTDKVTGLPNRRAFEDRWQQLEREGAFVSIAICDIDCFKQVNDTHGHAVGDRVLRVIADTLDQFCAGHRVARFGGEEFAILFEGIKAADAERCLERARLDLERRVLRDRDTGALIGTITFSAGIAEGRAGTAALLGAADELLYRAKKKGRNRICLR